MKRISAYIISILIVASQSTICAQLNSNVTDPDSVSVPLNVRIGADLAGPVMYMINDSELNFAGHVSIDLNEKYGLSVNGGYADYSLVNNIMNYSARGIYLKPGADYNLLKPQVSGGKYWAGIGLRYGISYFSYETPSFSYDNYWGTSTVSVPSQSIIAHFFEVSPGFNAKISDHINIGWRINIARLIYGGSKKSVRPVYIPGYGSSDKSVSFSINYYISFSFSYKTIKAGFVDENAGANYEEIEETTESSANPSTF